MYSRVVSFTVLPDSCELTREIIMRKSFPCCANKGAFDLLILQSSDEPNQFLAITFLGDQGSCRRLSPRCVLAIDRAVEIAHGWRSRRALFHRRHLDPPFHRGGQGSMNVRELEFTESSRGWQHQRMLPPHGRPKTRRAQPNLLPKHAREMPLALWFRLTTQPECPSRRESEPGAPSKTAFPAG